MKKRVVVGMSGGVDSSVAAALLKQEGYDVIGVTMQVWEREAENSDSRHQGCCSLGAVEDARRVAGILDIPYYVMNFREVFQKFVVQNFIQEYQNGRTPNPCVRCNEHIKFRALLERAQGIGADYIATGHYARVEKSPDGKAYLLKRAVDPAKDQSYVLYPFTQENLRKTILPLGIYSKSATREMAAKLNLPVADKPDSQEICFIPNRDYRGYLEKKAGSSSPGKIVNHSGDIIGEHSGVAHYTVGQRKGLGSGFPQPLYVLEIRVDENVIVVGMRDELGKKELIASQVNIISGEPLAKPIAATVKIRSQAVEEPATVYPLDPHSVHVVFDTPQLAVTPGQAVVFYQGDTVIGGGTIS